MYILDIHLLHTVFRRVSDRQKIMIPNTMLAGQQIHNVRRSPDQLLPVQIQIVPCETTSKTLHLLESVREHLQAFARARRKCYYKDVNMEIEELLNGGRMKVKFSFGIKGNFADEQRRMRRTTEVTLAVKDGIDHFGLVI